MVRLRVLLDEIVGWYGITVGTVSAQKLKTGFFVFHDRDIILGRAWLIYISEYISKVVFIWTVLQLVN